MINIAINGIFGKMGQAVLEASNDFPQLKIVFGVDKFFNKNNAALPFPCYKNFKDIEAKIKADIVIDFSRPDALDDILEYCIKAKCNTVLATTGYSENQLKKISDASKDIAVFQSANMSIGINLLSKLINLAAKFLGEDYDVEIIEKHHNQKVDAPSGTALLLADSVSKAYPGGKTYIYDRHAKDDKRTKNEIGISSVRGGNIVGEHEIMFIGKDEVISFTHTATSRSILAAGALKAALFIKDKKCGKFDMDDMINN